MAHITFITGGQRSGKSRFAQELALSKSQNPIYLATSRVWDEGHAARIERHKLDRGSQWQTIEEEKDISKLKLHGRTVVMDCVTLWLTNFFYDMNSDVDQVLSRAKKEFDDFSKQDFNAIVISNEIGLGGHPTNELMMKFTDLQGWTNQYIASKADDVYLMVSGIPVKIK